MFWKWIVQERLWLSFDLGLNRTWALYGSVKVINQTSNGPWTNNVRHSVIIRYLKLVKTRKIENLVREFGFLLSCEMSQMREREKTLIFLWCVKRPNILMWLSLSKGYGWGNSDNEKIHAIQILRNLWAQLFVIHWQSFSVRCISNHIILLMCISSQKISIPVLNGQLSLVCEKNKNFPVHIQ